MVRSADTDAEAEAFQVRRWREMSGAERLKVVGDLCDTVRLLAMAGIRQRFPDATPREQFLRLAILTLGADLAVRVYPDAGPFCE